MLRHPTLSQKVVWLSFVTLLSAWPAAQAQKAIHFSLQDKEEIVTAVAHAIQPPTPTVGSREYTLTLTIDGTDADQLVRHVMATYPKSQRFISNESRVDRDHCYYDKETGLPSVGIGMGEIKPLDSTNAELQAGSAVCMMGANGATYRLRKTAHGWDIVEVHEDYII